MNSLEKEKRRIQHKMDDLDLQLITISGQIAEAQAEASANNNYSDPIWWRKVNEAAKFKGRSRQQLQRRLGEINSQIKEEKGKAYERSFVAIAREILPEEQYQEIRDTMEERGAI